jgi:hypothetical protein
MNNLMLYLMVGSIAGMFTWAGFEYAKAGIEFLRDKQGQESNASATTAALPDGDAPDPGGR